MKSNSACICNLLQCVETGHGLQHMLTRVEHGDAAGKQYTMWQWSFIIYFYHIT